MQQYFGHCDASNFACNLFEMFLKQHFETVIASILDSPKAQITKLYYITAPNTGQTPINRELTAS
jgi:hypothetical protein